MGGNLGLGSAVSIALGGMIGGGIYAVLGVVTGITGAATWAAFGLAGVIALCAGYSYVLLGRLADQRGGSVSFVQCFTGNATAAGMVGWTLLFGYVGSMAMYAFAFAEFAIRLPGVPTSIGGLPARPLLSIAAVAAFVGLNLLGTRATGATEIVLVAGKVLVLVAFGAAGLGYLWLVDPSGIALGAGRILSVDPVMAAAVSFVAFQGWQLLFYDQESIADPDETVPTAIGVSILVAVGVYALVAIATFNLAPEALTSRPHTALVDAATTVLSPVGLGSAGGVAIAFSAVLSTGSAINATLFSAGHFAKGMLSRDLLPDRVGDGDADGLPERIVLGLGAVTAAFSVWGSLEAIATFASLAFILVFGGMSLLAFRHRSDADASGVPPLIGAVGAGASFPLMFYHLWRAERRTLYAVLVIAAVVVAAELLYFEHDRLVEEIEEFGDPVGDDPPSGSR